MTESSTSLDTQGPAARFHGIAPRSRWSGREPITAGARIAHYASLVLAFPLLLYITRSQWFFFDEWDFLTGRGFAGRPLDLFAPHSEHWSTIPILIYRGIFAVVGLHSYAPYLAVVFLAHITVAHLLWRLMLRLGVDAWVATALSGLFLVLGGGWENLLWAFQMGFVGSVAFGLGAMLVADVHEISRRRQAALWLILIGGLMCSGVGVAMVAVVSLVVLFRRGFQAAVLTLAVPAGIYIVWFIAVGRRGFGSIPVNTDTLLMLFPYVWTGITSTLDAASGFTGAGAAIAVGMLAWLIWRRNDIERHALAFAGTIGAVVFFAINGVGRASLGATEATATRYTYIAAALLLPLIALVVTRLARRDLVAQAAVVGVITMCALQGLAQLEGQARAVHLARDPSRRQILAAAQLIAARVQILSDLPDPVLAPNLNVSELTALLREGKLPPLTGLSPADRLSAMAALQTSLTSSPTFPVGSARVISAGGAVTWFGPDGCFHLDPSGSASFALRLDLPRLSSLSFMSPKAGTLQLFLQQDNDDRVTANPVDLSLAPNTPVYLNVLVPNATPFILSPPSNLTICGVVRQSG